MKKKKLSLNKKTLTELSNAELKKVIGGNEAYTTSHSDCTHFLCCEGTCDPSIPCSNFVINVHDAASNNAQICTNPNATYQY